MTRSTPLAQSKKSDKKTDTLGRTTQKEIIKQKDVMVTVAMQLAAALPQIDFSKFGDPHGNSTYKPEYCIRVAEIMSRGASKEEVALELGVWPSVIKKWVETHEDFAAAIKDGELLEMAWWARINRIQAFNPSFNSTLLIYAMSNRFRKYGYTRQDPVQVEGNVQHNHEHNHRVAILAVLKNATEEELLKLEAVSTRAIAASTVGARDDSQRAGLPKSPTVHEADVVCRRTK